MTHVREEPSEYQEALAAGPGLGTPTTTLRFLQVTWALALLGLVPRALVTIRGTHAFGPLDFTAILSIAAVLFAVITILRAKEGNVPQYIRPAWLAMIVALARVLIYPLAGL